MDNITTVPSQECSDLVGKGRIFTSKEEGERNFQHAFLFFDTFLNRKDFLSVK
jgi:hypothetical protein